MMKILNLFAAGIAAASLVGCDVPPQNASGKESAGEEVKSAPAALAVSKNVPSGWTENLDQAKAQAKKEGKKILVAFSGSDWCHWCVKLDEEVYSRKEFLDLAAKKYVLVMIDNPMDQSRLSDYAKGKNRALTKKFGVDGFPCGIVCDADGAEIGRIGGYIKGGPAAYFAKMENCRPGPLKADQ